MIKFNVETGVLTIEHGWFANPGGMSLTEHLHYDDAVVFREQLNAFINRIEENRALIEATTPHG